LAYGFLLDPIGCSRRNISYRILFCGFGGASMFMLKYTYFALCDSCLEKVNRFKVSGLNVVG